jgi:hypothetical protein
VAFVLLIVVAGAAWWFFNTQSSKPRRAPRRAPASRPAGDPFEARRWIRRNTEKAQSPLAYVVRFTLAAEATEYVDRLYKLGAMSVLVDPDSTFAVGARLASSALLIRLPDEQATRATFLQTVSSGENPDVAQIRRGVQTPHLSPTGEHGEVIRITWRTPGSLG